MCATAYYDEAHAIRRLPASRLQGTSRTGFGLELPDGPFVLEPQPCEPRRVHAELAKAV